MRAIGIELLFWLAVTLPGGTAISNDSLSEVSDRPAGHQPRACVGYSPTHKMWGWNWMKHDKQDALCAPGFAVFEIDNPSSTRQHWFNCCPLPAADILEDDHLWAQAVCPIGYVVTGLKARAISSLSRELRCTKVNTRRYQLGPPTPGISWGAGRSGKLRVERNKLRKTEIPDVIASSFGRKALGDWDGNGCTGQPVGSLFVGTSGENCAATKFQQLLFKGVDSDPYERYPVEMFPRCLRLTDLFDPSAHCSSDN